MRLPFRRATIRTTPRPDLAKARAYYTLALYHALMVQDGVTAKRITYESDGFKIAGVIVRPTGHTDRLLVILWCRGGIGLVGGITLGDVLGISNWARADIVIGGSHLTLPRAAGFDCDGRLVRIGMGSERDPDAHRLMPIAAGPGRSSGHIGRRGVHFEGEAGIASDLATDGTLLSVRIVRSRGDPMLDRLAFSTVGRAAPFPRRRLSGRVRSHPMTPGRHSADDGAAAANTLGLMSQVRGSRGLPDVRAYANHASWDTQDVVVSRTALAAYLDAPARRRSRAGAGLAER